MRTLDLDHVAAVLPGYDIGTELGRGGFGTVLAAQHRLIGRHVAVKAFLDPAPEAGQPGGPGGSAGTGESQDLRSRFLAEARVLAGLDHPHIVRVFDYVERDGLCLLVMEQLTGGTLRARAAAGLPPRATCCAARRRRPSAPTARSTSPPAPTTSAGWAATGSSPRSPVPAGRPVIRTALSPPAPTSRIPPGCSSIPPVRSTWSSCATRLSSGSTRRTGSQAPVPGWLTAPAERPRVYVTLGTVSFGAVEVIRAVVDDLASLDVDVLVAAGPEGDPAALGPLPERVRAERFVAQSRVLGLVDVAVHHGGAGTVLGALANGVPQVLLPQGADHFHNARMLAERGAARVFHNDARQPGDVATAVRDLLGESPERSATATLAARIAASPAPADVVTALAAVATGTFAPTSRAD